MQKLGRLETNYIDRILDYVTGRLIRTSVDTAVKTAFMSAIQRRDSDKKNILREVEDLITAREVILENIEEYREELRKIDMGISTETSSSDVVSMAKNRMSKEEYLQANQIMLEGKLERDMAKIKALDKGLVKVKDNPYFKILLLKYRDGKNTKQISKELGIREDTVKRENKRMLAVIAYKMYSGDMI